MLNNSTKRNSCRRNHTSKFSVFFSLYDVRSIFCLKQKWIIFLVVNLSFDPLFVPLKCFQMCQCSYSGFISFFFLSIQILLKNVWQEYIFWPFRNFLLLKLKNKEEFQGTGRHHKKEEGKRGEKRGETLFYIFPLFPFPSYP